MNTENRVYLFFFLLTALILIPLPFVIEAEAQSSFLLLPDSLTSLGSNSFTGVISAADIYIPSGVSDIGDDVLDISRVRVHCLYGSYAWNYFAAKYPVYTSGLIPWNGIKPTGRTISNNSKAAAAKTKAVTALLDRFQNSGGMELLLSYDTNSLPLSNTAFTYDNALAAMAFLSDGKPEAAARILDSFVYAVNHDRLGANDRIRNAYLAGPVDSQTDIIPAGWWNESAQRWEEDAYQVGCNTGNTAFAALALLQYDRIYGNTSYLNTAQTLMDRILADNTDDWYGFTAGYDGWPENGSVTPLTYKSIEHNIDAYAVFSRLYTLTNESKYSAAAQSALELIRAMYDTDHKYFYVGTGSDGQTPNRGTVVLDAIVWNQMALGNNFSQYYSTMDTLHSMRTSDGGFPFTKGVGSGWWTEGTAFTMLMYHLLGAEETAAASLDALLNIQDSSGLFPGTNGGRLPTGLNYDYSDDLHTAPTAWFIMAVNGFNPYQFAD